MGKAKIIKDKIVYTMIKSGEVMFKKSVVQYDTQQDFDECGNYNEAINKMIKSVGYDCLHNTTSLAGLSL